MAKRGGLLGLLIGGGIRRARALRGMTQDELAHRLGITVEEVCSYECGVRRIEPELLAQIAQLFGVPIGFFFFDEH